MLMAINFKLFVTQENKLLRIDGEASKKSHKLISWICLRSILIAYGFFNDYIH